MTEAEGHQQQLEQRSREEEADNLRLQQEIAARNLEDAQDAAQDALLTLWQKCREYEHVDNIVGFMVGMARGAALSAIQRRCAAKRGGPHPEQHDAQFTHVEDR